MIKGTSTTSGGGHYKRKKTLFMKYNTAIKVTLLVIAAAACGVFGGMVMSRSTIQNLQLRSARADKLSYTLSFLEGKYVDSITRDSIIELVLPKVLSELDPHSSYITKEEFAKANEPLEGQFDGIGVMFNMLTDTILVTNVIAGGPSSKAGVQPGDMIMSVNGTMISGQKMDNNKVVSLLRGKRGSVARLAISRHGANDHILIEVIRGIIPIKSLEAALIIDDKVGYIKFTRFASTTYNEVLMAMERLRREGAQKFIIDLRGNSGGYLEQAIYISNELLPAQKLIVYTKGAHYPRTESISDGRGKFIDVPLAVLIDEGSASASEIVAGALQDHDRGVILGRRSFGKGLVQEQVQFPDNSAARITIARYYTPLGRSIQKPYIAGDALDYNMELYRRIQHNELFNKDSIHGDESKKVITAGGKVLYGGGGITPDIFVPLDTTAITPYFRLLFAKNIIFKFATQLTENNRDQINQIKTYEQLDDFFNKRNVYLDFVNYADRYGIRPATAYEMSKDKKLITAQIKGYVGRNTELEESAFSYYIYPHDEVITKALDTFKVK